MSHFVPAFYIDYYTAMNSSTFYSVIKIVGS